MKIRTYYVIFVYILQGKMGKMKKKEKKSCNESDQNTKNQKTKYGMNETNMLPTFFKLGANSMFLKAY